MVSHRRPGQTWYQNAAELGLWLQLLGLAGQMRLVQRRMNIASARSEAELPESCRHVGDDVRTGVPVSMHVEAELYKRAASVTLHKRYTGH
jgi:hypothetical protein